MENLFTTIIKEILRKHIGDASEDIFGKSKILQYIDIKTRSANRGAKARGSFANLYAIYIVIEDYLAHSFDKKGKVIKRKNEGSLCPGPVSPFFRVFAP